MIKKIYSKDPLHIVTPVSDHSKSVENKNPPSIQSISNPFPRPQEESKNAFPNYF